MTNEFDEHDPTLDDMPQGDEAGMPIGTSDFGAQSGFISGEAPSAVKRHAGGALLLTAVVAVAIIGLFSMRTLTRASAATQGPTEVEKTIESFLKMIETGKAGAPQKTQNSDVAVLDVLSESYTQRQVALTDVQRNPFIIFEPTEAAPRATPKEQVDPRIEMRRLRALQLERASERLRLGSIMMGNRPLANINNQVLRVGDSITVQPDEVLFTVTSINATSVNLIAKDDELELSLPVTVSIRRDR